MIDKPHLEIGTVIKIIILVILSCFQFPPIVNKISINVKKTIG